LFSPLGIDREDHCRVPQSYKENGFPLGQWVSVQRQNKSALSEPRVQRLNELGFDWNPLETAWEEGFCHLKIYKERYGDCLVPVSYKDEDGYPLGQWVFDQRQNRKTIPKNRLQRLEECGFDWNPLETAWNEGLHHLISFKKRTGHCLVPVAHNEGDYGLGKWVNRQRTGKNRMSRERRRQLDQLGFVWKARKST
jgi:helicase associated protein